MMEDCSTTPASPWDGTSASWSPPGLPTPPEDNVPAPSGPGVPVCTISIGPTPTRSYQHRQRTPSQPHHQLPRKTLLHQPLLAKAGSFHRGGAAPGPQAAVQPRPPLLTDPDTRGDHGRKAKGFGWFDMTEGARRVLREGDHEQVSGTQSRLMATGPMVPEAPACCRGASSIFQYRGYPRAT